jgi:RecA/RadA recombinase
MGKILKKIARIPISTCSAVAEQFETEMSSKKIGIPKSHSKVNPLELVPTGSTIFNLECSGRIEGAFKIGKMVNLIGDSSSGKTLFGFTIFAECALQDRFDNYRFIYDDVEAANEFDLEKLFGKNCAERIEQDNRSKTVEDFSDNFTRALNENQPFIYILDSFDALTSEAALVKDSDNRKAREKGNEIKGDYGDGKPKVFSRFCSMKIQDLSDKGSVLIVISQTRDNIGFGAQFTPKVRSGGKALKFYSFFEIWLACHKKEKKGSRTIITNVQAKITKNKLTGHHGEVIFPILNDYGVDNLRSCIDFLMEEGEWTGTKKNVNTKGFIAPVETGKKESHPSIATIIQNIEDQNREDELFAVCQIAHEKVMNALKPKRKPKY